MSASSHIRQHRSLLAAQEKRLLIWIAERLPRWLNSDHLSALGLSSMAGAGLAFALARWNPAIALPMVVVFLVLNWFGDSLDGTVARVRNQQRPRYGFYVDHVIDLAGTAFLFTGLALSGFMSPLVAALVVCGFFLISAESFLATHTRGVFNMSFGGFGPTELRILIAAGALKLLNGPLVDVPLLGQMRLFDIGGVIGAIGMVGAFIVVSIVNVRALYIEETLPPTEDRARPRPLARDRQGADAQALRERLHRQTPPAGKANRLRDLPEDYEARTVIRCPVCHEPTRTLTSHHGGLFCPDCLMKEHGVKVYRENRELREAV